MSRATLICLFLVTVLCTVNTQTGPTHGKVVVCYISSWAGYRAGKGSFSVDYVDPSLCTHLIYAFALLDQQNDAIKPADAYRDLEANYGKGGYRKLNNYKESNPHLKVLLALGGSTDGSVKYSGLVADPERRSRFVQNALNFIQRHGFDGLDVNWVYPTKSRGYKDDRVNFAALVKELNEAFKPQNLLITSTIASKPTLINEAYDIPVLSSYLDFMHVTTYDYNTGREKKVGANAPLRSEDLLNVEYTISHLIELGAPPGKLVLGLPFYGRTYIERGNGITLPSAFAGPYTKEDGFMGYNEMCIVVQNGTWERNYDANAAQLFLRQKIAGTGQTKVIVSDNPRSIANKVRYGVQQNLAGFMIWSIDTDDFLGECPLETDTFADYDQTLVQSSLPTGVTKRNYPLLRTTNQAIGLALLESPRDITPSVFPTSVTQSTEIPMVFEEVSSMKPPAIEVEHKTITKLNSCGERQIHFEGLITNGYDTKPGDFPWHVALFHRINRAHLSYKCGGIIINPTTILTAGHCLYDSTGRRILAQRVVLQLGRYHLYTPEAHSQEFQVYQIKLHPQYDPSTLENDIAITKLANAITFNSYIQPICLWDSSRTSLRSVEHKVGTVMGWGYTEEDEASDVLKGGTMPVVPFEDCLTSAREFFGHFLSDKNYCAGFRNGTSVCNGDSGGGMIFEINNVWYIRGVVSLSMKREKDNLCNTKNYVLFTDVAKYLDWIESESI